MVICDPGLISSFVTLRLNIKSYLEETKLLQKEITMATGGKKQCYQQLGRTLNMYSVLVVIFDIVINTIFIGIAYWHINNRPKLAKCNFHFNNGKNESSFNSKRTSDATERHCLL